jgi:cytochrome c oxidase cbb3-type subunit 2
MDEYREPGEAPALFFKQSLPGAIGILLTVIASYVGLVVIPDWQVRPLYDPVVVDGNRLFPPALTDQEERGKEVYISLGCIYCHSQQVRQDDFGGDISRGWGRRASIPFDYAREGVPLLGTMRTGPDLRNIGVRQPSEEWHYLHLYNPRITSPGSIMPPFRFLFEAVPKDEVTQPPRGWIDLPDEHALEGHYVKTTQDAEDLVAYLLSLQYDLPVPPSASRTRAEGPVEGEP